MADPQALNWIITELTGDQGAGIRAAGRLYTGLLTGSISRGDLDTILTALVRRIKTEKNPRQL